MGPGNYYQYKPLDPGPGRLRLLRVHKGGYSDAIQCELFETSFDEIASFPYEALSYTWGTSSRNVNIHIAGQNMLITRNLHMALLCLRRSTSDRIIWIDALCIDQENKKERGHQVGQMGQIFKNAEGVIVWLSPHSLKTDVIMDLMMMLEQRVMEHKAEDSFESWLHYWSEVEIENGVSDVSNKDRSEALGELFSLPWFRRVWILQEVANARKATIICGSKIISSRVLTLMRQMLDTFVEPHVQAVLDIMPGNLRRDSWWADAPNLVTLLVKFRGSLATDPRDKIYALLGMSSDACESNVFPADYHDSPQSTIQNTISFLLFGRLVGLSIHRFPDWDFETFLNHRHCLAEDVFGWAVLNNSRSLLIKLISEKVVDVKRHRFLGAPLNYLASVGVHEEVIRAILERDEIEIPTVKHAMSIAMTNRYTSTTNAFLQYLIKNKVEELDNTLIRTLETRLNSEDEVVPAECAIDLETDRQIILASKCADVMSVTRLLTAKVNAEKDTRAASALTRMVMIMRPYTVSRVLVRSISSASLIKDLQDNSLVMLAVEQDDMSLVLSLLEAGANVDRDTFTKTIAQGHERMIKRLFEATSGSSTAPTIHPKVLEWLWPWVVNETWKRERLGGSAPFS